MSNVCNFARLAVASQLYNGRIIPTTGIFPTCHAAKPCMLSVLLAFVIRNHWWHKRPVTRTFHDDVIKWKHFPRYFVRGIRRSPVNSPHTGQWRGFFSLICVWTNGWVNNRYVGDFRRHCAHYDVTVMCCFHYCLPEQAIEETVEWPIIWDAVTLTWRQYNGHVPSVTWRYQNIF